LDIKFTTELFFDIKDPTLLFMDFIS